MANQVTIDRQTKVREEGEKAFRDGKPMEGNPYPKPKQFQEEHQGQERGAWDFGWMSAQRQDSAG